jgi:hypothetical protein
MIRPNQIWSGIPPENRPDPRRQAVDGLRQPYRDRTVTLVGKWRTDICPGSSVAVEVLTGDKKKTSWAYGCVTAVRFIASADQPYIATRLTVGFLRDASEQTGSPLVADDHPVFDNMFIGGGMR